MLIKISATLYMEVSDDEQAEEACSLIDQSIFYRNINDTGFPHGTFEQVDVDKYEHVSDEEARERGLVED